MTSLSVAANFMAPVAFVVDRRMVKLNVTLCDVYCREQAVGRAVRNSRSCWWSKQVECVGGTGCVGRQVC